MLHFYPGWPYPGGTTYGIKVLDESSGFPSTELLYESGIPGEQGKWNFHEFTQGIFDPDGKFFIFYIQEGSYPDCFGLSEDKAQEDPGPDWWCNGSTYGQGFPRNDFLLRAGLNGAQPKIEEDQNVDVAWFGFPTITDGSFNLSLAIDKPGRLIISTYDHTGRLVARFKRELNPLTKTMSIDLTHLPSGVYFLRLETPTRTVTNRIIIVH